MTSLPAWASNKIARALIDELLASPPETRVSSANIMGPCEEVFTGKPFCRLRRIRTEWVERELATLDRIFHATHRWDDAEASAVLGSETAEDLVRRLLREAAGEEDLAA